MASYAMINRSAEAAQPISTTVGTHPVPPLPPQSPPLHSGAPQEPKQGKGTLAGFQIGWFVVPFLCLIALAAAYLVKAKMGGPLKKSSAVAVTVRLDDAKSAKLSLPPERKAVATKGLSKKGATNILPSWVPVYPGATIEGGSSSKAHPYTWQDHGWVYRSWFSDKPPGTTTRSYALTTADSVDKVVAFYQGQLKKNGFILELSKLMAIGGQTTTASLIGYSQDNKRRVEVLAQVVDDKTNASFTVIEKP